MIDFLKNWVMNIITLVIFLVLIEILIPSGRIKKYINLVTGVVLLIAVINPFVGLVDKGIDLKDFQLANSNFIDRKEIEQSSKILKDSQVKQITETYRSRIIKRVEESINSIDGTDCASVDVVINEDSNSEYYGEVKRIYITLKPVSQNSAVKPVAKVEKIEIVKNGSAQNRVSTEDNKMISEELRKNIVDKINKILNVQKENIVIMSQNS